MNVQEVLKGVHDVMTVKRVFGDPIERDGVTIVPVAVFGGGGGGGGDGGEDGDAGLGFGMGARPAGVYVIQGGEVSWRPAIDVNRLVVVGAFVLILFRSFLLRRGKRKAKAKRRKQKA